MLGSDAWLKKDHDDVKGLGTSLRGQTRVSQRWLGCLSPQPSEVHSARARHTAVVVDGLKFVCPKSELLNHTSKQTNDPSTVSASDLAPGACASIRTNEMLFLRPDQNLNIGIGFAKAQPKEMRIICLFQVRGNSLCFFLSVGNPQAAF